VVINYRTNEADFPEFVDKHYEKELRRGHFPASVGAASASILVMSPWTAGHLTGPGNRNHGTIRV